MMRRDDDEFNQTLSDLLKDLSATDLLENELAYLNNEGTGTTSRHQARQNPRRPTQAAGKLLRNYNLKSRMLDRPGSTTFS